MLFIGLLVIVIDRSLLREVNFLQVFNLIQTVLAMAIINFVYSDLKGDDLVQGKGISSGMMLV